MCGKFDETCGELKISLTIFLYKIDIFGGLKSFLAIAVNKTHAMALTYAGLKWGY